MTSVNEYPLPSNEDDQDCEIEGNKDISVGITYEIIWRDIFLDGNMPRLQDYIISKDNNKSYVHFWCLYLPNIVLRGISQVFLCNHPITGIFICIGLALTSVELMMLAIIGSSLGAMGASVMGGFSVKEIENGLAGKVI